MICDSLALRASQLCSPSAVQETLNEGLVRWRCETGRVLIKTDKSALSRVNSESPTTGAGGVLGPLREKQKIQSGQRSDWIFPHRSSGFQSAAHPDTPAGTFPESHVSIWEGAHGKHLDRALYNQFGVIYCKSSPPPSFFF